MAEQQKQKQKMIKVGTITPEIEKICRSKKTGKIKKSNKVFKKSPFVGCDVYRVIVRGEKKYRIGRTKYAINRKEYLALKELGVIEPASQAGISSKKTKTPNKLDRNTLPSIEPPDADKQYADEMFVAVPKDDGSRIDLDVIETSTFFDDYTPVFDMGIDKKASVFGMISEFFGGISESVDKAGYNVKEKAIRNLEKERPSVKAGHKHYMK